MVSLIVLEEIDSGRISFQDSVKVSRWASKIGGHQVYLKQGEIFQLNIKEENHEDEDREKKYADEIHKEEYKIKSDAAYLMINYQFNKSFNFGIIGDYYKETYKEADINPSIFFGFSPVEESTVFRLKVGQVEDHKSRKKHLKMTAQIIWSLGPHKPHRY